MSVDFPSGWDRLADDAGSFYHHSSWINAVSSCFDFQPFLLFEKGSHGDLSGILPLALVPKLIGPRRLVSFPFSYAVGTLCSERDAHSTLMRSAIGLAEEQGAQLVEVKQKSANVETEGFTPIAHYSTYLVPTELGEEEVWKTLHKSSTQRGIKRAAKLGVEVVEGHTVEDWAEMSRLQHLTSRKHGVPPPPAAFFTGACKALQEKGRCDLFRAVTPKGELAASVVIWKGRSEWIYAFGATDERHLEVRPIHAILWHVIRQAIQAQVRFDLGRAAPEQESLVQFKERWAGRAQPLQYDYWPVPRGLNSMQRDGGLIKWASSLVKYVPVPIYGQLSRVYRYLG